MESDTMKRSSWLSAGGTEGVLGRDADKGRGKGVRFAVHSDGVLLHDLKQRGLGFRGGSVYFIGNKNIAHNKSVAVFKAFAFLIVHSKACYIGRHDIGGELNTSARKRGRFSECHCERCFSRTRHVLYQHMTAGKQGGNKHFHYVMLAYNDFFNLS